MSLLQLRKYYPQDIDRQIHLLSIEKNSLNTKLIGSMSYKVKNASDVDLFEMVSGKNKNKVVEFFWKRIRYIVSNLSKHKDQFFFEVKCGLDPFISKIDIGTCCNGVYNIPIGFEELLNHLYDVGILDRKDMNKLEIIMGDRCQLAYETVNDVFRRLRVLRWNERELKNGYKTLIDLQGNEYKYSLYDAIMDKTECNIEEIFINSNNDFCESSNFYQILYVDKEGTPHGINCGDAIFTNYRETFSENLKLSMYKLMNSQLKKNYNPFKVFKRLFSYARFFNDEELAVRASSVLNSQLGELYKICAKIKTVLKVIENPEKKYVSINIFKHQLDYIGWELQGIVLDVPNLDEIIDIIYKVFEHNSKFIHKKFQTGLVERKLHLVVDHLMVYINEKSMEKLKEMALCPLPSSLMPSNKPF